MEVQMPLATRYYAYMQQTHSSRVQRGLGEYAIQSHMVVEGKRMSLDETGPLGQLAIKMI